MASPHAWAVKAALWSSSLWNSLWQNSLDFLIWKLQYSKMEVQSLLEAQAYQSYTDSILPGSIGWNKSWRQPRFKQRGDHCHLFMGGVAKTHGKRVCSWEGLLQLSAWSTTDRKQNNNITVRISYDYHADTDLLFTGFISIRTRVCNLDKTLPKYFGVLIENKCGQIKWGFRKFYWLLKKTFLCLHWFENSKMRIENKFWK